MILETEITMLFSAEIISHILLCIWIYRQGIINKHWFISSHFQRNLRSYWGKFSDTYDDAIETDYSLIDTEPLDIYSRQDLYDEDVQNIVYGTKEEFNNYIMI